MAHRVRGVILTAPFLFLCLGCFLLETPASVDYSVTQKADLSDLLVFYYIDRILGVDTADYTVKGVIHAGNMLIGGVAKLPGGGVAFTHERYSNNALGNKLYVTDKNCNLLEKYSICPSPTGPKSVNGLLFLSSSVFDPGGTVKFQILGADDFRIKKEFSFPYMGDTWMISHWNDKAYIGINPEIDYPDPQYSYMVELDLNTLDTVIIADTTDFFLDATFLSVRDGSRLYIYSIRGQAICIYDLDAKTVTKTAKVGEYPEIAALETVSLVLPRYYNGFLYGLFTAFTTPQTSYLVKLDPNTLEYVSHVKLAERNGIFMGDNLSYEGRFLVRQFLGNTTTEILFEDMETGSVVNQVTYPPQP